MRMDRRRFLRTAAMGAAGLTLADRAGRGDGDVSRPNVLYIMTDQQRWDTIHASGNDVIETPNLDRLAEGGANFTRHYTAAFPCSPSRATLISGRYAHSHGVWTNDTFLDESVRTLGEVSRDAGYDTAWIGKWHLGGDMYGNNYVRRHEVTEDGLRTEKVTLQGLPGEDEPQHGFEHWVGGFTHYHRYLEELGLREPLPGQRVRGNHHTVHRDGHSLIPEEHFMTAFLAKETIDWLQRPERRQRPFTLCLSFYGPHLPITPPEPWDTMYAPEDVPLPGNVNDDLRGKPWRTQRGNRFWVRDEWTDEQYRDLLARYWGYCSYIDHWTGRVLDALQAQGLADDTIVVYTSDHGEMAGSHGFIYKGGYMYDGVQRVPFIMRLPGVIQAGLQTEALSSSVDLLPTLTDLMGVEAPAEVQGRSMTQVLTDAEESYRDLTFTEIGGRMVMMRSERYKFSFNWQPRQVDELYDMQRDPLELNNLARDPEHAHIVERMRQRVLRWMRETRYPLASAATVAAGQEPELPLDVRPDVTTCEYLGDGRLRFGYRWIAGAGVEAGTRGFVQFINPRFGEPGKGDISFRIVSWPETPTEQWEPGQTYAMPTDTVEIPRWAGEGQYTVRIGLYDPEKGRGPALEGGTGGNYVEAGTLTVKREDGRVTDATFTPAD